MRCRVDDARNAAVIDAASIQRVELKVLERDADRSLADCQHRASGGSSRALARETGYSARYACTEALVEKGQIVVDEPVNLPKGTQLRVLAVDELVAGMSAEERAELERAIDEGYEDFAPGDFEDARVFASRLVAKS